MNRITIVGNVADDPDLRSTPAGVAVATCRVAVNRRRKDDSGIWREHAEHVAESLRHRDRYSKPSGNRPR
jgi:single-strand DNA-binding protein